MITRFITTLLGLLLGLFLFALGLLTIAVLVKYPELPDLEAIQNYQPREPLTIYSNDGKIIGIYGDERREFKSIAEFPQNLKNAVIAAEDKRFYEHWGVDLMGVARAVLSNLKGGSKQGASTITQQVARNFYLSNERTLTRKFNEALLAYKIEKTLTKDQILELYFNHIYLGQRAYGFAAAAKIYFNKDVKDLTLAEASILAGLPKAPSTFNPIVNPKRAQLRQEYILNNMLELGMIRQNERDAALKENLIYGGHRIDIDPNSLYVAEMARQWLYERYGEKVYTSGMHVYTTVHSENQKAATQALRRALLDYDHRSAYRGAEQQLDLSGLEDEELEEEIARFLGNTYTVEKMVPAIIRQIDKKGIAVQIQDGNVIQINRAQMGSAANAINNKKMGDRALKIGSLIRIAKAKNGWMIVQQPEIQGALVSLDVNTGAVKAVVGGYDYHSKTFNRATQSIRQPGSTFKPFVYSAALSKGMTAATQVMDAPLTIGKWSPKNSDGNYSGLMTLRSALVRSKNLVTIRIAEAIGVPYVREYAQKFGFRADQLPEGLAMSLGSGSATPLQMAEGYAVFANGGYKISSYVIDRIYDRQGNVLAEMHPHVARKNAPQVMDPRNAYIMTSIMQDVIEHGTARAAKSLKRSDLAGKTGTTNDNKDAWFVGYNPQLVTAVYLGYDTPRSLGSKAFGGTLALPVWINYMDFALKKVPSKPYWVPQGLVQINGEYYLKEQQSTSDNIPLDNSTSDPSVLDEQVVGATMDNQAIQGELPAEPVDSGSLPQNTKPETHELKSQPDDNDGLKNMGNLL
ncbi:MAG: penicillin-binding protein 1A [Alysiella sp.]|uniref:penicillin-binding protein 1A n=1 Tax=Alysiella sp. TaxID=1872483 RepID=UPI0026DB8036|nr:penicillin-binding protein 1A [Alysiella sp.]MDO4434171.1 penicillin-binding protein 1A [Alysiella sp.]